MPIPTITWAPEDRIIAMSPHATVDELLYAVLYRRLYNVMVQALLVKALTDGALW